jgi:hypothetical protein
MMKAITGESRATTWLAAASHLADCAEWEDYNLVLEILDPMRRNARDRQIEERVDHFLRTHDHFPLSTVAETIFPAGEYRRHGPKGVYETYPDQIYPAIKRLPELRWGTYAHRLVRRSGPNGQTINPLEYCIEKIRRQAKGNSAKTACYELSLSEVGLDLPLYDPAADRKFHIGGPCLSHVSLKISRDRRLLLTALYRSHYYVHKALGNLLGLARLQAFVCEQTNLTPGPLVCISTFATLQEGGQWSRKVLSPLLQELSTSTRGDSRGQRGKLQDDGLVE